MSEQVARQVAALLQAARMGQGLSYRALEDRCGVNYMRLQRILKGETELMVRELDAVADALGLIGWRVLREAEHATNNVVELPARLDVAAKDAPGWRDETDQ